MNAPDRSVPTTTTESAELEQVLQTSLYPGASLPSIRMVLGYCKAARLDPLQKPVHIVPMWDPKSQSMRDVVMPGINLYRTQAARSGSFAGVSEPTFGPTVEQMIGGVNISFPEWCRVTVRRVLPSGSIAEFTACEYWIENYAVKGGKEKSIAPNAMWMKRPRGQIAKCAEAQALRKAFPEVGSSPTAEEMEGKTIAEFQGAEDQYGAAAAPRGPQRKSEAPAPERTTQPAPEQGQSDPEPAEPAANPERASDAQTINSGQVKYLQAKMKAAGVEENSVLARFELGKLEDLDTVQFDILKSELLGML